VLQIGKKPIEFLWNHSFPAEEIPAYFRDFLLIWQAVAYYSNTSNTRLIRRMFWHNLKTLKPKLAYTIFNNSVRTAKKTQLFTITKINWLTLFKEIITVYSENHTKHIKNADLFIVKAGGTYIYH
jgi:hypothetical protein